jgi:hypothetical protein
MRLQACAVTCIHVQTWMQAIASGDALLFCELCAGRYMSIVPDQCNIQFGTLVTIWCVRSFIVLQDSTSYPNLVLIIFESYHILTLSSRILGGVRT